jgi:hypothetical protein
MASKVKVTLQQESSTLINRLQETYGKQAIVANGGREITVAAPGSADTLAEIVRLLSEMHIQPETIHAEPANLERVFLHLTGREWRD